MIDVVARIGPQIFLVIGVGAILVITLALYLSSVLPEIDNHSSNNHDRVVFSGIIDSSTHQIYIVNSNGTGLMNLTSRDDLWHFHPVPSGDGSKVAYETWSNFPNAPPGATLVQHLYAVNADGTGRTRLDSTDNLLMSSIFSWSPDSTKLAYESSDDIYVVNSDGTNTLRLTHDGNPIGKGIRIDNHNPFWSNNDHIVFSSVTFGGIDPIAAQYREIRSDGTGIDKLFDFDLQQNGGYVWSNDRKAIAFLKLDRNDLVSLWIMNATASDERLLIDSSRFFWINHLAWSPDDSRISFVGIERSQPEQSVTSGEIYIVNVKDGSFRQLQESETLSILPVWSSDGTTIAFLSALGEEAFTINIMDVNSNEKIEVARIKQSIANQPLGWIAVQ